RTVLASFTWSSKVRPETSPWLLACGKRVRQCCWDLPARGTHETHRSRDHLVRAVDVGRRVTSVCRRDSRHREGERRASAAADAVSSPTLQRQLRPWRSRRSGISDYHTRRFVVEHVSERVAASVGNPER